jgi:peptidoglycan/xylan/chitin deacetylase (PgdA/CDA1 family)
MEQIGCEIGNHTENHNTLTRLSASGISSVLSTVNAATIAATGHATTTVRPPGGSYNATVKATVNAPIILWSIDTLDWKTRSTQATINAVLNNVQDGDIILMHDIHTQSVDAALYLIPELQKRGYTLVTVSELAEAKGVTLQNGNVYTRIR